jgi:hypothetical protein
LDGWYIAPVWLLSTPSVVFAFIALLAHWTNPRNFYLLLALIIRGLSHLYICFLEGESIKDELERRSRYLWALSFWDVETARKTISQLHGNISLGTYLRNAALTVVAIGALLAWITCPKMKMEWGFIVAIYVFLVSQVGIYGIRFLLLSYLKVQWVFSTVWFYSSPVWLSIVDPLYKHTLSKHI